MDTYTLDSVVKDSQGNIINLDSLLEQLATEKQAIKNSQAIIDSLTATVTAIYAQIPSVVSQNIIDAFNLT